MLPRDLASIFDIFKSASRIREITISLSFDTFIDDWVLSQAAIRELEIIGEATKRLTMAVRDQYPAIPWKSMAGLRDTLIHVYDRVDLTVVWRIIQEEIPILLIQVSAILRENDIQQQEYHSDE